MPQNLGHDGKDLAGFQFVDNAFTINGLLNSGNNCIVATINENTNESIYYFADLTAKVCTIIQPEVAIAWAGIYSTIETNKYESEKEFNTLLGSIFLDAGT